jgi:F-type H+-transporting ATPase subunit b
VIPLLHVLAAAEQPSGISSLGIDPLAILAQGVTFLFLFWVIKKFALDKIVATLETRRKTIDDGVKLGQEMQNEKSRLQEQIDKALADARSEADKIIAAGNINAAELIKEAEAKAAAKLDSMLKDADARIEEEMKKARQALEQDMLSLVAQATEIIIGQKLDAKKDSQLIEKALQEAGHER